MLEEAAPVEEREPAGDLLEEAAPVEEAEAAVDLLEDCVLLEANDVVCAPELEREGPCDFEPLLLNEGHALILDIFDGDRDTV